MTTEKLFFQLIQVSVGQLDCLDRGPSPEEWQQLYNMSQRHDLVDICYDGVVRLFDFGLRAPQDLSIDWMAETETAAGPRRIVVPQVSHPLRRMLLLRFADRNGTSLYEHGDRQGQMTPSAAVVMLLLQAFEDFHAGQLKLRAMAELCQLLQQAGGKLADFRDGSSVRQMLQTFGIWQFSRAMMWAIGETTALPATMMACPPASGGGRLLLQQVMELAPGIIDRLKNRCWRLLKF